MAEEANSRKASKPKRNKDDLKNAAKNYAKYSGMAFQMAAIIFLGTFGGYKLDAYFGFESHILTLILSMVSVCIAIYFAVKDFIKK
jgi:hypothetical protein